MALDWTRFALAIGSFCSKWCLQGWLSLWWALFAVLPETKESSPFREWLSHLFDYRRWWSGRQRRIFHADPVVRFFLGITT
jgi:hypothetical protein